MRAWAVGLIAGLLLYGGTVAPGLLWGDSGEAQLQIRCGGLAVSQLELHDPRFPDECPDGQ